VAAGYEVKSSVAKGLTYLVTNDPKSGSSKNTKARQLGIKIITEKEFLALL
jgi:DNA ligase (NAD+)